MTLSSMTGFARAAGASPPWRWTWEIKSVNSKGLDLRLRLPPGFDAIEAECRARLSKRLARGAVYATLNAQRESANAEIRVNEQALAGLIAAIERLDLPSGLRPASVDGLLAVRGIVETVEGGDDEAAMAATQAAALAGLDEALAHLVAMRAGEGAALAQVLAARLNRIAELTRAADDCPARRPEAVRARLEQSIAALGGAPNLDPARLHQEALLLAARADVREELDRLVTHVAAARDLMAKPGAVGRRLDFLAQELAREANTLCSKSNDAALTAIGMELRVEIEQFREQIQNIE
jgi:uncharacterized protein (TIGR00255 family)